MKKVKFNEKLRLNKQIVSNLNEADMNGVKGGFTSIGKKCEDGILDGVGILSIGADCTKGPGGCSPTLNKTRGPFCNDKPQKP